MKRTLGDAQARPDYLIVSISVVFGLFCLGGWYSTHQKLNMVRKSMSEKRPLQSQTVGERIVEDSGTQELYESLLKDRKNGKILSPDFDVAANELKRRGVIHEPVDKELQNLYEESRKRGQFNHNPEMQALIARAIKAGIIHDVPGGSLYPKTKTGVIKVRDDQTGKIYEVEYSGKPPTSEEIASIVEKRIYGDAKGKQN